MKNLLITLVFTWICTINAVQAGTHHSLADIRDQVRAYIESATDAGQNTEIRVSALDSRLRLRQCGQPLNISPAHGQDLTGKTTLAVRCPDQNWTLMVPATIDVYLPVFISSRPLNRGDVIGPGDFTRVTRKVSLLPGGYISDESQVAGFEVRRFLRQGSIIPPSALTRPKIVSRGQIVTLTARAGGLVVRMKGEALSDGAVNQSIRVRNLSSRRIVQGIVTDSGTIQVKM